MLLHYLTLNLPMDATDAEIRERYLQLVRQFPPEKEPERFQRITEAFEGIKDVRRRVYSHLLGVFHMQDPERALRLLGQPLEVPRRRVGLAELLTLSQRLPS